MTDQVRKFFRIVQLIHQVRARIRYVFLPVPEIADRALVTDLQDSSIPATAVIKFRSFVGLKLRLLTLLTGHPLKVIRIKRSRQCSDLLLHVCSLGSFAADGSRNSSSRALSAAGGRGHGQCASKYAAKVGRKRGTFASPLIAI